MSIRAGTLAVLLLLFGCAPAWATPVTVQLRVEGERSTTFEGPVTTDAKALDEDGGHRCDGTNMNANPTPGPTATTALDDGEAAGRLDWDGRWGGAFGFDDYLVDRIGPDAANANGNGKYWGYAVNFAFSEVGGCQRKVGAGDEVLWAYDLFSKKHYLRLSGPPRAATGEEVVVTVVDGKDGTRIPGASVGGARTSADGRARVRFDSPGIKSLKALREDSVRSNTLQTCVYQPGTGACGSDHPAAPRGAGTAPRARISSPRASARYRIGPRLIRGVVSRADGLREVAFRLRRVAGRKCRWYSARTERFRRTRRCRASGFNRIGAEARFGQSTATAARGGRGSASRCARGRRLPDGGAEGEAPLGERGRLARY
jgi:hypothetical protein